MANTDNLDSEPFTLPPAAEFLASCPKFRLLVLGNIESTKVEIFSKVLGINFDKVSSPSPEKGGDCKSNSSRATLPKCSATPTA